MKRGLLKILMMNMLMLGASKAALTSSSALASDRLVQEKREQRSLNVYPVNDWFIASSPVTEDKPKDPKQDICVLSRNYFKGYRLYLSQNYEGTVTFLVEPPSRRDKYGDIRAILLTDEADFSQSLERRLGEGDKTLYLIRRESEFFDDFRQNSSLHVSLDKMLYKLNMEGFSEAMDLMEGCRIIETNAEPDPRERKVLQSDVEGYYQENPELLKAIIKSPPEQSIVDDVEMAEQSDNDLMVSLLEKISLLEREKEALRKALLEKDGGEFAKIRAEKSVLADKEFYEKKLTYLNQKIDVLVQENRKLKTSQGQTVSPEDESRIRKTLGQIFSGKDKVDEVGDLDISKLTKADLLQAYKTTNSRITSLTHKNLQQVSRIRELELTETKLGKARKEISSLKKDIQDQKEEMKLLRERRQVLDLLSSNEFTNPLVAAGDIVSFYGETAQLYHQIEDLHDVYAKRGNVVKMNNAIELLLRQIDELSEQNQELKALLAQQAKSSDESVSVPADQSIMKRTIDNMSLYDAAGDTVQPSLSSVMPNEKNVVDDSVLQEKVKKIAALTEQNNQFSAKVRELEAENKTLIEELQTVREEIQLMKEIGEKSEEGSLSIADNEGNVDGTAKILEQKLQEIVTLKDDNESLQAQIEELNEKIALLKRDYEQKVTESNVLAEEEKVDFASQVSELEARIAELQEQGQQKSLENDQLSSQITEMKERIGNMRAEHDAVIAEMKDRLQKTVADQENINAESKVSDNTAPQLDAETHERLSGLADKNKDLLERIERLRAGMDKQDEPQEQLAIEKAQEEFDRTKQSYETRIQTLREQIVKLEDENVRLRFDLEKLTMSATDKMQDGGEYCDTGSVETLNQQLLSLSKRNKQLLENLRNVREEEYLSSDTASDSQVESLRNTIEGLRAENQSLKRDLQDIRSRQQNSAVVSEDVCTTSESQDVQERIHLLEKQNEMLKNKLNNSQ